MTYRVTKNGRLVQDCPDIVEARRIRDAELARYKSTGFTVKKGKGESRQVFTNPRFPHTFDISSSKHTDVTK